MRRLFAILVATGFFGAAGCHHTASSCDCGGPNGHGDPPPVAAGAPPARLEPTPVPTPRALETVSPPAIVPSPRGE